MPSDRFVPCQPTTAPSRAPSPRRWWPSLVALAVTLAVAATMSLVAPARSNSPTSQLAEPPPAANRPAPAQEPAWQSAPQHEVEVLADEWLFDPESISAEPGEVLTVTLRNGGSFSHDIFFELEGDRTASTSVIGSGETDEVSFEAPSEVGSYVYYCSVSDHRERGMEGTLVIGDAEPFEVVIDNLASPRGLAVQGDRVLVSEGGTGNPTPGQFGLGNNDGRVTLFNLMTGERATVVEGIPNATDPGGGVVGANHAVWRDAPAASDTVLVAQAGGAPERENRSLVLSGEPGGEFTVLADLWAFEAEQNPDGSAAPDSNLWRIVNGPDGTRYYSDAGGNDIVKDDAGELSAYAVFEAVGERDNGSPIQPVPTGLVVDPANPAVMYVSLLGSVVPGEAQIRRLEDLNEDGDALDEGENTLYVDNLTMAVDLAFAPDGGLYVTEYRSEDGPGAVSRVMEGGGGVVVQAEDLPAASAMAFTAEGDLLVAIGDSDSGAVTTKVIRLAAEDIGVGTPATSTPTATVGPTVTPTGTVEPGGESLIYLPTTLNRPEQSS